MANLQIKGIPSEFYDQIKDMAEAENRSVSQQVLYLIKEHMAKGRAVKTIKTPAQVLLELAGSWSDAKDAEEIVMELKKGRSNSKKLSAGF
ncbi:MAG: hypothetical protein WA081_06605 [Desulfosalsimonadaceae bacterium]